MKKVINKDEITLNDSPLNFYSLISVSASEGKQMGPNSSQPAFT